MRPPPGGLSSVADIPTWLVAILQVVLAAFLGGGLVKAVLDRRTGRDDIRVRTRLAQIEAEKVLVAERTADQQASDIAARAASLASTILEEVVASMREDNRDLRARILTGVQEVDACKAREAALRADLTASIARIEQLEAAVRRLGGTLP